ncbi:heterokaryon incompatibility domain-containing protein [Trichoderma camerunense]
MNPQERINIRSTAGASTIYKDVTPLSSQDEEIRMLHLECGSGSSLLQCTLHRVSLRSVPAPSYEALSYTWGDENNRREIVVNGYIVDVTFNLYSALCRFRLEDEARVLWIDALCINQTDLDERSQQVQLMRNVYTTCDQTVIWIGEPPEDMLPTWEMHWTGDEHDDESMDWFWKEFYSDSNRSNMDENDSTSIDQIFHAFANLRLLSSGHLSDQPLFIDMTGEEFSYYTTYSDYCRLVTDALATFYDSPWWTRIWTVQEIILPPKAKFVFGPISVDMSCLLEAFAALACHMFEPCCSELFSRCNVRVRKCFRQLGSVLTNIKNMRASHGDGTNVELWETLTTFRARHATDNRDKVHGVLGLVNKWSGQPIVPNYRAATETIYCQAAISTAIGTQSLFPLHFPLQKHACPTLPSWCVDWTAASALADQLNVYQWSQQPFKVFPTHGPDHFHIVPRSDNRILEVRGRRCDRVASVGKICQGNKPNEKRKAYCDWFLLTGLHRYPSRVYRSESSYFEAFWKCLCWDMILHMSETAGIAISARSKSTESYEAFVGYCHSSLKSIFHPEGLSQADREAVLQLDKRFQTTEDTEWGQYSQSDFLVEQWINGLTLNTTFFVTNSGYLGLGPPETKIGDEVWCLFGGQMPFILRPVATTQEVILGQGKKQLHQVFGTCYVHGIMDGEIANDESIPADIVYLA